MIAVLLFLSWHLGTLGVSAASSAATELRAQSEGSSSDALLRDSELVYEVSGGFAGVDRRAVLASAEQKIAVGYRSGDPSRGQSDQSGTLSPKEYVALWHELERSGLWTLDVRAAAEVRTEVVRHTLRARVGSRVHEIVWTESDTTPAARSADRLGSKVSDVARRNTARHHLRPLPN